MEIYFVRHGQTGGNVAHRHQVETSPLTKDGEEQARITAELICSYEPTHLVTSNLVRAVETARIIGETCDLIPETNEHFIELKRPEHLYGNFHKSPQSLLFYMQWYRGRTQAGESYEELRQRIFRAKEYLRTFPDEARIAVVSHSVFINLFLAHMCKEEKIGLFEAAKTFGHILTMPNASVTPVIYDPVEHPNTCGWMQQ